MQMIIWRDQPLENDHLSPLSPQSTLPGSRFNLAELSRTIGSCFYSEPIVVWVGMKMSSSKNNFLKLISPRSKNKSSAVDAFALK